MSTTAVPTRAAVRTGPAAAAILSASVGCCALAVIAAIGDGSRAAARLLTFWKPTGPLSGVSTLGIVVWLGTWLVLHRLWREKDPAFGRISAIAAVLLAIGFLLTFPPFEDLLLGK